MKTMLKEWYAKVTRMAISRQCLVAIWGLKVVGDSLSPYEQQDYPLKEPFLRQLIYHVPAVGFYLGNKRSALFYPRFR